MEFRYKYKLKASDLWQMYMYHTYSSYLCIINIICILSSVVLIFAIWDTSPDWMRIMLILFLSLFTVIQPLGVYSRSRKAVAGNQEEMELIFDEAGIKVLLGGESEFKKWKDIKGIVIKPTVIIIYTDEVHGYVIADRVLGDTKKQFKKWIKAKRPGA